MWWTNFLFYSSFSISLSFAGRWTNHRKESESEQIAFAAVVLFVLRINTKARARLYSKGELKVSARARERENKRTHVGQFWWVAAASLSLSVCVSPYFSNTTRRPSYCRSKWTRRSTVHNSACLCHIHSKRRFNL